MDDKPPNFGFGRCIKCEKAAITLMNGTSFCEKHLNDALKESKLMTDKLKEIVKNEFQK